MTDIIKTKFYGRETLFSLEFCDAGDESINDLIQLKTEIHVLKQSDVEFIRFCLMAKHYRLAVDINVGDKIYEVFLRIS